MPKCFLLIFLIISIASFSLISVCIYSGFPQIFNLLAEVPVAHAQNGPPVVSGLVLHLDADAIDGLSDNDPVAQWDDLSGEDNHATQGTSGYRPIYKTNILNGKPVVRFDGSDDRLNFPNLGISSGNNPLTIIVIFTPHSLPEVDNWQVSDALIAFRNQHNLMLVFADQGGSGVPEEISVRAELSQSGWTTLVRSDALENFNSYLIYVDFDTTNGWRLFQGGSLKQSNSNTETIVSGTDITAIGGVGGGTNRFYEGDIAEILIYNRALTTQEKEDVEQYLGEKWLGWELDNRCKNVPISGNYTVASDCFFDYYRGMVNGIEQGNITIDQGITLTIHSGQAIVFNPGQRVSLGPGAKIAMSANSRLSVGYIWYPDADEDDFPDTLVATASRETPGGSYYRRSDSRFITSYTNCGVTTTNAMSCGPGRFLDGENNCVVSDAGYYSPACDNGQSLCAAGRYGTGGDTDDQCTGPCAAGYYGSIATRPHTNNQCTGLCAGGKWSAAGAETCSDCLAGRYGTAGTVRTTDQCTDACQAGCYCVAGSALACNQACGICIWSDAGAQSAADCYNAAIDTDPGGHCGSVVYCSDRGSCNGVGGCYFINGYYLIDSDLSVRCWNNGASFRMWPRPVSCAGTNNDEFLQWGIHRSSWNTSCIGDGPDYPACDYCDNLNWKGYSDWHLPSIGKLDDLFDNAGSFGVTSRSSGEGHYWSSSQDNSVYEYSFAKHMRLGWVSIYYKDTPLPLRCVRGQ